MPLWGTTTSDESKPKYLSGPEKTNTFATSLGWVQKRDDGTEELLVSIGGLAAALANSNITAVFFANTAASYVQANANAFVTVAFNEKVTVTGSPTLAVTGNGASGNAVATYNSGSGTNKLNFKFTVPSVTQTLSIGNQSVALAGGSIVDAETVAATLSFTTAVVTGVRDAPGASANVAVA